MSGSQGPAIMCFDGDADGGMKALATTWGRSPPSMEVPSHCARDMMTPAGGKLAMVCRIKKGKLIQEVLVTERGE